MQFEDLLEILYDIEQLKVIVNKEREYYGTVKEFKEFEELLLLKIQKISTEKGKISVILKD